jgi:hypothetical protein
MGRLKFNNKGYSKGQLLVEAIIAISIMLIGMMGTFGVLSQSLGLSRVVANQYIAVNLASEGIEIVKNIVDSDYQRGKPFGFSIAGILDGQTCAIDYLNKFDPQYWDCRSVGILPNLTLDENSMYSMSLLGRTTPFKRYVTFLRNDGGGGGLYVIKVTSVVRWLGRGGSNFEVTVEDRLYKWRRST